MGASKDIFHRRTALDGVVQWMRQRIRGFAHTSMAEGCSEQLLVLKYMAPALTSVGTNEPHPYSVGEFVGGGECLCATAVSIVRRVSQLFWNQDMGRWH